MWERRSYPDTLLLPRRAFTARTCKETPGGYKAGVEEGGGVGEAPPQ